jgi:hypothetical protein
MVQGEWRCTSTHSQRRHYVGSVSGHPHAAADLQPGQEGNE